MSISPLTITGISTFSDDFQTVLTRAVSIATLPVTALQNQQGDILVRKQLTTTLGAEVEQLRGALSALGELGASRAIQPSSSNVNRVAVTSSTGTPSGTYTITDITSIARAASESTVSGFATADSTIVDPDGVLELVVGGTTHELTLTDNSLDGLRDAINALGSGVTATVINTGTGGTPYYLSLTSASTGATTLQLRATAGDSGSNLLTSDNQGSDAVFKLNGLDVVSPENVVSDLIEGVSLTIVSETDPGESVYIDFKSSKASLTTAVSNFVTAYNAVADAVTSQVGENAGLLSGDFLVRHILGELKTITGYSGEANSLRLSDLGIELGRDGKMTANSNVVYLASSSQLDDIFDFLGTAETGFGALATRLEGITDPINGMVKVEQDRYDAADQRITEQVGEMITRIEYMQASLVLRLQQADAVLAALESQQKVIGASIQGLELTLYGRRS